MRKFFIAIDLLVLVVAVSYLKAVRDQDKVEESYEKGQKASEFKALALESDVDSLHQYIGKQNVMYAESLTNQQVSHRRQIDSIAEIVDSRDGKISELDQELKDTRGATKTVLGSKPKLTKHQELLSYYKKRFQSLPTDLTNYERKVAITEIRQETARKYSMSISELNRIREKNNLDY